MAAAAILVILGHGHALAQRSIADSNPASREAHRERLFGYLANAQSERESLGAEAEIRQFWYRAPDAEAADRMNAATREIERRNHSGAIAVLDALIARNPDWPEPWNLRATTRFLMSDYDASLADIAETLKREPKHFGALGGKAMILFHQGKDGEAKNAIREVLAFHPFFSMRALLDLGPPQRAPGRDI